MTLITGLPEDTPKWRKHYRHDAGDWEYLCEHGIGHWELEAHSCDGCCKRNDYPLRELREKNRKKA